MTARITEVDGFRVTWFRFRYGIEILSVHNMSRGTDEILPPGTDLAAARERRPDLKGVWDRVRCEFWSEYTFTPDPTTRNRSRRDRR